MENTSTRVYLSSLVLLLSPIFRYNPAALNGGKHSSAYLASSWAAYNGSDTSAFLTDIFARYGITDANATEINVATEFKAKPANMDIHLGQSLTRRALVK